MRCLECRGFGLSREYVNWMVDPNRKGECPRARCTTCPMGPIRTYYDEKMMEICQQYNGFEDWAKHQIELAKVESDYYLGLN